MMLPVPLRPPVELVVVVVVVVGAPRQKAKKQRKAKKKEALKVGTRDGAEMRQSTAEVGVVVVGDAVVDGDIAVVEEDDTTVEAKFLFVKKQKRKWNWPW